MLEKRFKTLMSAGQFVDYDLLNNGVYSTEVPHLFDEKTTINDLVEKAKFVNEMSGSKVVSEKYIENLKKCELVDIYLVIDETDRLEGIF